MGYLNRKIIEPPLDGPTYDKWEAENSIIMSCYCTLCNRSLVKDIYFFVLQRKFGM